MSTNYYQHDTTWLELARALEAANLRVESAGRTLLYAADWTQYDRSGSQWRPRKGGYPKFRFEAVKEVREELASQTEPMPIRGYRQSAADLVAEYDATVDARGAALEALWAHDKLYTGWERYFLVVSSPGLIHSSTRCSTCNKGRTDTLFALLPTLSGQSYSDAVDVLGPSLCSVCFPQAPVAVVDGPKIPVRVAEVLFGQGPEAFLAALEAHNIKQAAKAAKKGS